jgi:hypothetical protein
VKHAGGQQSILGEWKTENGKIRENYLEMDWLLSIDPFIILL